MTITNAPNRPTKTLDPASEIVAKGFFNATTLSAVDADLAVGNIKTGITIFGKAGTVIPGGTETIEKFADATIAAGATYTIAQAGIYSQPGETVAAFRHQYYSSVAATWYKPRGITAAFYGQNIISDGTNAQLYNTTGGNQEYCLMRHYLSTGTYERARDEQLAASATWTPAVAGFFALGAENNQVKAEYNETVQSWFIVGETTVTLHSVGLLIGDGTNFRVKNQSGATAYRQVAMRAKMTP